jgi:hypothetical protein
MNYRPEKDEMVSIKTMPRLRSLAPQLITGLWLPMPRRELYHSCLYSNLYTDLLSHSNLKVETISVHKLIKCICTLILFNTFNLKFIDLNVCKEYFFPDIWIGEITMLRSVNSWSRSPSILVVTWSTLTWSKAWILLC